MLSQNRLILNEPKLGLFCFSPITDFEKYLTLRRECGIQSRLGIHVDDNPLCGLKVVDSETAWAEDFGLVFFLQILDWLYFSPMCAGFPVCAVLSQPDFQVGLREIV